MPLDQTDLSAAFGYVPEEVIALIAKRGLETAEDWRDAAAKARAGAFTAARTAGYDVLADIRAALERAMREGKTYEEFAREITPVLQRKGWWGKAVDRETGEVKSLTEGGKIATLGAPWRLRTIYETNLQVAFNAGRYRAMKASQDTHPFWEYVAVLDLRTRPAHRMLHGRVFRLDDPATGVVYPPNGFRCRCRSRPISQDRIEEESLVVSSGAGHISAVEIPRKDKPALKTTAVKLPGMPRAFIPDPGWDHNPAEGLK